jgi:hypothetical protein
VAGEKVLMFFFPPKNYEFRLGRWCGLDPQTLRLFKLYKKTMSKEETQGNRYSYSYPLHLGLLTIKIIPMMT